jgi:hypothetical protein
VGVGGALTAATAATETVAIPLDVKGDGGHSSRRGRRRSQVTSTAAQIPPTVFPPEDTNPLSAHEGLPEDRAPDPGAGFG